MSDRLRRRYVTTFTMLPEPLVFDRAISDRAVRLWAMLDRLAGAGDSAMPTRAELARMLGCSTRTVDTEIGRLRDRGWLDIGSGKLAGRASEYAVTIPEGCAVGCAPLSNGLRTPAQQAAQGPASDQRGRETDRGIGKDQTPTGSAAPAVLTITQRSKRITDAYAEAQPMCRWPAINGIVVLAIKSGRYHDDEIREALLRLAAEGRSVSVESLRIELDGLPPPRNNGGTISRQQAEREDRYARQRARAEARETGHEANGSRGSLPSGGGVLPAAEDGRIHA